MLADDEEGSDASSSPEETTQAGAAGRRKFDDEEDDDDVGISPPSSTPLPGAKLIGPSTGSRLLGRGRGLGGRAREGKEG